MLPKILVFFSCLTIVCSIRCFQCNSHENPECADLKSNDTSSPYLQDCPASPANHSSFCRKIALTILDVPNEKRVTRTCGWISDRNESSCKKFDTDFKFETNCQCFHDGCNGVATPTVRSTLCVMVASFLLFIDYH